MHTSSGAERARRRGEPRLNIMEAALELFVEKGFGATRAIDIAERGGLSKPTLFKYFRGKREVLEALVEERLGGVLRGWTPGPYPATVPGEVALRSAMSDWWARVSSARAGGVIKVMIGEGLNFPALAARCHEEAFRPAVEQFEGLIQCGMKRGEFRSVDAASIARGVLGSLVFLATVEQLGAAWPVGGAEILPSRFIESHAGMVARGMAVVV